MGTNKGVRIAAAIVAALVGLPLLVAGAALLVGAADPPRRGRLLPHRRARGQQRRPGGQRQRREMSTPAPPLASDAALDRQLTPFLLGCLTAAAFTVYTKPPAQRPQPARVP